MTLERLELSCTSVILLAATASAASDGVLDDFRLTVLSILGSWCGSFIAVSMTQRGRICAKCHQKIGGEGDSFFGGVVPKYIVSMMCGVCFSPVVFEMGYFELTSGRVVCVSCVIASIAWSSVHALVPFVSNTIVAKVKSAILGFFDGLKKGK